MMSARSESSWEPRILQETAYAGGGVSGRPSGLDGGASSDRLLVPSPHILSALVRARMVSAGAGVLTATNSLNSLVSHAAMWSELSEQAYRLERSPESSRTQAAMRFYGEAQQALGLAQRSTRLTCESAVVEADEMRAYHQLIQSIHQLLSEWHQHTGAHQDRETLHEALSHEPREEQGWPASASIEADRWRVLTDTLLGQEQPDEGLVNELVGEGMEEALAQVEPLVCHALSQGSPSLCYELCHALLDFERTISPALAQAVSPWLDHESRRVFMAALYVLLKQEDEAGHEQWREVRTRLSPQHRDLGDELLKRVRSGRG